MTQEEMWLAAVDKASQTCPHPVNITAMSGQQIPGPAGLRDFAAWTDTLKAWRDERRKGFDSSLYDRAELKWTQSSFVQVFILLEDRSLYDVESGRYTLDKLLEAVTQSVGAIDSVVLWTGYPNIGIDDRNQIDLLHDIPGGLAALKQLITDLHRRNIRAILPVLPWDVGTRAIEGGIPQSLTEIAMEIGLDAFNGDTMNTVGPDFTGPARSFAYPVAFEPELGVADLHDLGANVMTWGYWHPSPTPSVSMYKWFESRHMVHLCQRWARNKTEMLQSAFMNGVGWVMWENVWGIWNGITPRDGEAMRRISTLARTFDHLLTSPDWEPYTPLRHPGVFGSRFPSKDKCLWTIVSRRPDLVFGEQMIVPHIEGRKYFDAWNGVELFPMVTASSASLEFEIQPMGFAAVLATDVPLTRKEHGVIRAMQRRPSLEDCSDTWECETQEMVDIKPTRAVSKTPAGMVEIPAGNFDFYVSGTEIEGEDSEGVDVQYPWENRPRRHHHQTIEVDAIFMDRYPVTNAQFQQFLMATGYQPKDSHNFLRNWTGTFFPAEWKNKPVTWVSMEDARAYAQWQGKRLPHDWEWQYAAQGTDQRLFPWGNDWDPRAMPPPDMGRTMGPPADVDAHPFGASPFGVLDMVGNVWQWTEEFVDRHTRAAIIRGGSYYRPQGSHWYLPQAYPLNLHTKYLLMSPGRDRAATIGFRCVVDKR
jgi:formylglycine-generating enzyme required for sulfatase activity